MMEHNSKDADPSHLEKLVDLALEFDDDLILERAEAFHELARLNPARARALVFEIFDDPHRNIPAEDPTDVDKSRGFYEDHQALAFEVLHAISPVQAVNYVKDHPATTPHEVLAGMLCYLTSDTYLLEPNPPELEQAMAALLDVVSRLPRNIRPELAEEVEFFHRRLNEIKSGSPLK